MRERAVALACGALFGFGLALSGMVEPGRVRGFLDVTGAWDPTLAFVMGGAVFMTGALFPRILRRGKPLFHKRFFLPEKGDVDAALVLGALIFGVGWGLAGLCPGPALAALVLGSSGAWLFATAMALGMMLHRVLRGRSRADQEIGTIRGSC
jgi:uncharacterized protein